MLGAFLTGTTFLAALAVLAGVVVVITAVRFAVKLAIRVGVVAVVVLASLYAVGVIG